MFLKAFKSLDIQEDKVISNRIIYHFIFLYFLIIIPIVTVFPFWLSIIVGFVVITKIVITHKNINIYKFIQFVFLFGSMAAIFMNYSLFGREYVGLALLTVFSSLKLLETTKERDLFLLMLVNMLLIIGSLMVEKSFINFVFMIFCFFYNCYIQLTIAQPVNIKTNKDNLKTIFKIIGFSIPFVVLLFFFFPRLPAFWEQTAKPQAVTGLSDKMSPNSLSSLAQSDGIAFKVIFPDNKPPDSYLQYWRGPVLTRFDGSTWKKSIVNYPQISNLKIDRSSKLDYTVKLDGTTNNWLLSLDIPYPQNSKFIKDIAFSSEFYLKTKKTITKSTSFDITSYTKYNTGEIGELEFKNNTIIPDDISPKTRDLAKSLYEKSDTNEDYINKIMEYFRNNEYYYSLEPPLGNSDIDTFIFNNKIGYCEHYSSSMAFMLRAVGIPARIVTGYQGGERNPISKEFEIRQLNALAWVEVYIKNKCWIRVDPTAAVAPNRISNGNLFNSLNNSNGISTINKLRNNYMIFKNITNYLNAGSSFWQNWVVNFNISKQNSFLTKLGLQSIGSILWIILITIICIAILVVIYFYNKKQQLQNIDEVEKLMLKFLKYLQKLNIKKEPHLPISTFIENNKTLLNDKYSSAIEIVNLYQSIRYEKNINLPTYILENKIIFFIKS